MVLVYVALDMYGRDYNRILCKVWGLGLGF